MKELLFLLFVLLIELKFVVGDSESILVVPTPKLISYPVPASYNYKLLFQDAFIAPTNPPYNSILDCHTGITYSGYATGSDLKLEAIGEKRNLRGNWNSLKEMLGASPSPVDAGRIAGSAPAPSKSGLGSYSPTVDVGWEITLTGIPDYDHTIPQEEITTLNNRPKASSDFVSGATTASAGDRIQFGQNIGYTTDKCSYGYWPPGPMCPVCESTSWIFDMAPAPETNKEGCYVDNKVGFFVNGVSYFSWTDTNSYNSEGVWWNLVGTFEQYDMDICGGHASHGTYHHHGYSQCLANWLGDTGSGHSPLYGFAFDSYPIYGPWQADGELAVSCWDKRDYSSSSPTGCSDGQRSCQLVDQYDFTKGTRPSTSGPNVGSTVTSSSGISISSDSGCYFEDMFWNFSCSLVGGAHLDEHNGHSHDNYGYHYHMTVDSTMTPTFPYGVGPKYFGCIRYGSCNYGYAVNSTNIGDSTCGISDLASLLPVQSSNDDGASSKTRDTLTKAAIIGIVIGCVVFFCIIWVLLSIFCDVLCCFGDFFCCCI